MWGVCVYRCERPRARVEFARLRSRKCARMLGKGWRPLCGQVASTPAHPQHNQSSGCERQTASDGKGFLVCLLSVVAESASPHLILVCLTQRREHQNESLPPPFLFLLTHPSTFSLLSVREGYRTIVDVGTPYLLRLPAGPSLRFCIPSPTELPGISCRGFEQTRNEPAVVRVLFQLNLHFDPYGPVRYCVGFRSRAPRFTSSAASPSRSALVHLGSIDRRRGIFVGRRFCTFSLAPGHTHRVQPLSRRFVPFLAMPREAATAASLFSSKYNKRLSLCNARPTALGRDWPERAVLS